MEAASSVPAQAVLDPPTPPHDTTSSRLSWADLVPIRPDSGLPAKAICLVASVASSKKHHAQPSTEAIAGSTTAPVIIRKGSSSEVLAEPISLALLSLASSPTLTTIKRAVCGLIHSPCLPEFRAYILFFVMSSRRNLIPKTPEVISPSLTEGAPKEEYFGRKLRSATRANKAASPAAALNGTDGPNSDPEKRARTRSRSPLLEQNGVLPLTSGSTATSTTVRKSKSLNRKSNAPNSNGTRNGHLQPPELSAGHKYWREISRSPSPSGSIPIHSEFKSFVCFTPPFPLAL